MANNENKNVKKDKPNYISLKDSRKIIKYNIQQMKYYESLKNRKLELKDYTSTMKDENNLIEIDDLHTSFFTDNGTVKSVNGVSFNIPKNKIIGVVGESGCGKSVTSLSIMQLIQAPQGQIVGGEIRFNSDELGYDEQGKKVCYDITKMPTREMYRIRGKDITMIFQEPMTSLNPVFTIGSQLDEVYLVHAPKTTEEEKALHKKESIEALKVYKEKLKDLDAAERKALKRMKKNAEKEYKQIQETIDSKYLQRGKAKAQSIEMLKKVGISMPDRVYRSYPHELSGGMRQRVMIAMALAGNPKLIIADEPTTALDVTIQAQILDLLRNLQQKQGCSILLITHDLGVIAEMADEVVVMYAGKVIEKGTVSEIFHNPLHPYTIGLQKSKPQINSNSNEPLYSIPGQVPNPINMPNTCYFKNRCSKCIKACDNVYPELIKVSDTHYVSCYLYNEGVNKNGK